MHLRTAICVVTLIIRAANSEYMGCYLDEPKRKLEGGYQIIITLTPSICIDYCKTHSYAYAGLQFWTFCFCGNQTPLEYDRKPDSDCGAICPGDWISKCGGTWRNSIYKTGYEPGTVEGACDRCTPNKSEEVVTHSVTTANGQPTFVNQVVFEETFDTLSPQNWSHVVRIPFYPHYRFSVYNRHSDNSYISDGKLVIKPTVLPDREVKYGQVRLPRCTGNVTIGECGYRAKSFMILPPVQTAHLTTRNSFKFRYGKVEITAKLPMGDWLVPELSLDSQSTIPGTSYPSERIRIAMSRGNWDLRSGGQQIGNKLLESGAVIRTGDNSTIYPLKRENEDGWYRYYHNYTVVWSPDNITFFVDEGQEMSIPNSCNQLSNPDGASSPQTSATKVTHFGSDFYISLKLYAGGLNEFPDNSINRGVWKPWINSDPKALLRFWQNRDAWKPSWNDDLASLKIDYIKVTAL